MPVAESDAAGAGDRSVRAAGPEDAAAITEVTNRAYVVEAFFVDGTRTTEPEVRQLQASPGAQFLVVDDARTARIIASVYMELRGRRGYFAMLAVDPQHQGRGLARLLIEAVEARCRAAGCRAVDIEVVDLRTELPPFYAKLGFVPSGTAPFKDTHKLRRPAHAILMTKRLERD